VIRLCEQAVRWASKEKVHIISMSWSIDVESGRNENKQVEPLRQAIQEAVTNKILLFCANPDRGRGYTANKTYPRYSDDKLVFCVGAATQSGHRWDKIDPDDNSCDLYLPGVDLGIPVETMNPNRKGHPPNKWDKYSGSSLACALAAGLAAMVLHTAKVSGVSDEQWGWLREKEGMDKAFESMHRTNDKWIPVPMVFKLPGLKDGNEEQKKETLKQGIVQKFFKDM
jgi:Subtilase family